MTVLLFCLVLVSLFAVGWFVVSPALEWVCRQTFALSLKGYEYHQIVKTARDGQGQDQTT